METNQNSKLQSVLSKYPKWLFPLVLTMCLVAVAGGIWLASTKQADKSNDNNTLPTASKQTNVNKNNETAVSNNSASQATSTPSAQPNKNVSITKDWKTYINKSLGFGLLMPTDIAVDKEMNDQYNRLVTFQGGGRNFEVRIKDGSSGSLDNYFYLDFTPSASSTLGGEKALIFKAPHGYCDGPGCGPPFIAYSALYKDKFYNIVFFGDTELDSTEKAIVSSFQFFHEYDRPFQYPSLDGRFTFEISGLFYLPSQSNNAYCEYEVKDNKGHAYDISKLVGSDVIPCSDGEGGIWSSFKKWVDGDKFLMDEYKGEVKIVDVEKSKVETYNYDPKDILFRLATRSLEYWLFQKGPEGAFVLLNKDHSIVLTDFEGSANRSPLYDPVNNGFLFITRTFNKEDVSVKFDFLSLDDMKLSTVLTTEPVKAPGRGCYPEEIVSQKHGEIILTQGCILVDKKYISSDKNIHIQL